ncbi:hypothetical protein SAMN04515659_2363 [Dyella sp. 333MFSha]|nr:hypothetical protein SAMN04515659_2363 [Dyella sp. 333MFSha]
MRVDSQLLPNLCARNPRTSSVSSSRLSHSSLTIKDFKNHYAERTGRSSHLLTTAEIKRRVITMRGWLQIIKKKRREGRVMVLCSVLSFPLTAASNSASLCKSDESIAFSCKLSNEKFVSLCRRHEAVDKLTYRFGRNGKSEMEFTDSVGRSSNFRYEQYSRYQRDYFDVSFTRKAHEYTVFHEWSEDSPEPESGVIVQFPSESRKPMRMTCTSDVEDSHFRETTDIGCSDDPLFGCMQ